MKKIVLITTGQPAINPRVVKEADSLTAAGYDVTVLYCYFIKWANDFEREFLPTVAWKYQQVGGSPARNKLLYHFTRARFKLARSLNQRLGVNIMAERAQARAFDELLRAAKKTKADLYIAHNLGALPVAVKAARYHRAKAGFDFEDYHRGEFSPGDPIRKRVVWLENKYIPGLSYYSSSSPMIANAVQADHPRFCGHRFVLLNCFPTTQRPALLRKQPDDQTLKLFWFSQTIGKNRGLETVIDALKILNNSTIQLTLAGRCDDEMRDYIQQNAGSVLSAIHFAGIIQPSEIPSFASQFDAGLAIELNQPTNRDLCLTNKLFTYLLAGNAVLASETSAQKKFFSEYGDAGLLFECNNPNCLAQKIKAYRDNPALLKQHKANAYAYAERKLNWEMESKKFIAQCRSLLS